jgi:hypothetical protein
LFFIEKLEPWNLFLVIFLFNQQLRQVPELEPMEPMEPVPAYCWCVAVHVAKDVSQAGGCDLKRFERYALLAILAAIAGCLAASGWSLVHGRGSTGKWLASAGLLLTVAGLLQLEVSGLIQRVIEDYRDPDLFPFGPPSYVTREIIDHPDRPIRTWFRNATFHSVRTGFWMIVAGTLVQVAAVWL